MAAKEKFQREGGRTKQNRQTGKCDWIISGLRRLGVHMEIEIGPHSTLFVFVVQR